MKRITILLMVSWAIMSCSSVQKETASEFMIGKGTNLAHWLSQSSRRGDERRLFIQEKDFEYMADLGFQHVRLPIDEEQMWDEQGRRHEEAFEILNNCIGWAIKNDLRVIVDLHILRSHHFNAAEKPLWTDPREQEKFCDMWRDLSSALHKYPVSMVAYELMNEAVADDAEDWNKLLNMCFAAVRETEPARCIVIGSNRWQSASTFDELKVPDDPHIILSYHFYEPFLLTHYHASWTALRQYTGPVHYPGVILTQEEFDSLPEYLKDEAKDWIGREFNRQVMTEMMQKPFEKAKALNLPLYCGEYGVLKGAPEEDRLRWYADMMQIFKAYGVSSANWNYKSDQFGLINNDGSENAELVEIIAGSQDDR